MIRNFLLITFRNFFKNKFFVIANVLGLGVALACCIIAYYNTKFHTDFDRMHRNKEMIYKASLTKETNGRHQPYGFTPLSLAPAIGNSISGIDQIVRYTQNWMPIRYGEHIFSKGIAFVDSNYFDVFDLEMIEGSEHSIREASNMIISDEFAGICFGNEDPLGKTIKVYLDDGDERLFRISGIYKDQPLNTSMQFDLLCQIENHIDMNEIEEHKWTDFISATFFMIPDASKVESIEKQLERFVPIQNDIREDWPVSGFYLEPLRDIPTTGRDIWGYWLYLGLHPAALVAPTVMAIMLLLLACLNFTNTALAISSRRLKEIGMRKVFGGVRKHTMIQFLGENMVLCIIALLFALAIGPFLIDAYSDMWPYMTLKISLLDGLGFWFFLLLLLVITGLAAGSYPAFYVSRFNPIHIFQGSIRFGGGGLFSKILLVFQFILAISAIISAVIFTQNAHFQDNLYLGYEKDKVIGIPAGDNSKLEVFHNAILQNPMITSIGKSEEHIGWGNYNRVLKWGEEQEHEVDALDIGKGYFETMGLRLISGRYFDQQFRESEREKAILINETFVKTFGWDSETAIGQRLKEKDTIDLTVIGVFEDYYPYGFWSKIDPTMLKLGARERMRFLTVQAEEENLKEVNEYLQQQWEDIIPNAVYRGFFQEDRFKEAKDINRQIKKVFMFLAIVSVLLSLVGLYTLVSLTIIKKTKEIGIRKVLGASIRNLVYVINREYIIIIFIGSVLGSVLGYYLSVMLMGSIWEVHFKSSVISFIIPLIFILLISIITLAGKVYRAAIKNPVDAIKYE